MTKLKLIAAAAGAFMIAGAASAQEAQSDAGALIVAPLQIANQAALYFGTIAPSITDADTVIVSAAGAKTCGAALTCLSDDHTAAAFLVTGDPDRAYTIELPSSIEIASGDNSMIVDNFAGSQASGTLTAGEDSFTVGGRLNVGANQASGEYTGAFTVAVNYQ